MPRRLQFKRPIGAAFGYHGNMDTRTHTLILLGASPYHAPIRSQTDGFVPLQSGRDGVCRAAMRAARSAPKRCRPLTLWPRLIRGMCSVQHRDSKEKGSIGDGVCIVGQLAREADHGPGVVHDCQNACGQHRVRFANWGA